MEKEYVILYDSTDLKCKIFTELHRGYKAIDWSFENQDKTDYINADHPHPGFFPAVVEINSNIIINGVGNINNAIELIDFKLEKRGKDSYKIKRLLEYKKEGLTAEKWMIAMIQKEVDNDSTEYDSLVSKRAIIKNNIKKAEVKK